MIQFQKYNLDKASLLFLFSNYVILQQYTNFNNKVFDYPLIRYTNVYLFIDISEYTNPFYVNIKNDKISYEYYFFETNDHETIENYIPISEQGTKPSISNLYFPVNKINNQNIGFVLKITGETDIYLRVGSHKPYKLYNLTNESKRTFEFSLSGYDSEFVFLYVDILNYPDIFYVNFINNNFTFEYYLFETNNFETIKDYISLIEENGIVPNILDLYFSLQKSNNKGLVLKIKANSYITLNIGFNKPHELYNLTNISKRTFDFPLNQNNQIYLFIDISLYTSSFYINFIKNLYEFEYYLYSTNDFQLIKYYMSLEETGTRPNINDSYFTLVKGSNKGIVLKVNSSSDIHLNIAFKKNILYNLTNLEKKIFDYPLNKNDNISIYIDISEYPNTFYVNFINSKFGYEYYLFEIKDFDLVKYNISLDDSQEKRIVPTISDYNFCIERQNKMGLIIKIQADSDIHLNIGFNKPNKIYNLTNLIKRQFDFSLNQTNIIYLYVNIENYPNISYINFINNNYSFEYYLFDINDFGTINYYISLEETGIVPNITDSYFVLNKNNKKGLILKINSDSDIHLI